MIAKTTLPNGVRLVSEKLDSSYSVTVGFWVEAGSRDEQPGLGGVSHFIEHMAFKGTASRDPLEIARQIDRLGGAANAFTSKEKTCFHARALSEFLPEMLDLLTDLYLRPVYRPEELERERQVILSEIASQEDTPDDLVHILGGLNYWPEHPLGRPILGTAESVTGLEREAILDYLDQAYRPERLVVAAVGNLEHERLVDLLTPTLGERATGKGINGRTPPAPRPGLVTFQRDLEQAHAVLSLPAPTAISDERFAAGLLNTVLGGTMSSRLFQEVREKRGLAYAVYSFLHSYCDAGLLGMYLGVQPERLTEALQVVAGVLQEFASAPLSDEELGEAKDHLKSSILLSAENPEARMSRLARNEMGFGREVPYQETMDGIFAVTPEQLQELAGRMLDASQLGITVLGPVDQDKLAAELNL